MLVSIFNDVIGPVMRGPSSSHCAAALRIGRIARDLMGGEIDDVLVEFDRAGSLPATHDSQGSDMGLFGGLLGWDADDERLPGSLQAFLDSGAKVRIETVDVGDPHPNTYRLTIRNAREQHALIAISTGGGMMEVIRIDDLPVHMDGGWHETLVWLPKGLSETSSSAMGSRELAPPDAWKQPPAGGRSSCDAGFRIDAQGAVIAIDEDEVVSHDAGDLQLVQVKGAAFVPDDKLAALSPLLVRKIAPVLPVPSRKNATVPFGSCADMLTFDGAKNTPFWQLAVDYERARGRLSEREVVEKMIAIVRILRRSIEQGIAGTSYEDRVLGHQSGRFAEQMKNGRLLDGGALNRIVLYVTAMMEVKSSMGVIVAAPTAGACAALPGAVIAMAEEMKLGEEEMARAFLAAGLIGVFIASRWTFAAEVGGCQAEGGSAAAMSAAALVTLAGGTRDQAVAAASLAMQSMLGLICDPVANRVEAPCLGKNVMAASNALACANMAIADYDPLIPFDEVVDAAKAVAEKMPREHRCTALGGLSVTPTSLKIEARLAARKGCGCRICP
jgi:L-serine dehydratase